jgi:hypothetical protein
MFWFWFAAVSAWLEPAPEPVPAALPKSKAMLTVIGDRLIGIRGLRGVPHRNSA